MKPPPRPTKPERKPTIRPTHPPTARSRGLSSPSPSRSEPAFAEAPDPGRVFQTLRNCLYAVNSTKHPMSTMAWMPGRWVAAKAPSGAVSMPAPPMTRPVRQWMVPSLRRAAEAKRFVLDAVTGFGAIQPLLDDPAVEEIWINAPTEIYVARNGESELTGLQLNPQQIRDLVEKMLKSSGRRLDLSSPFVDAALPDGSRLHVVIPDTGRSDC